MTPGFPREFRPAVLKTLPGHLGGRVRGYHPLWRLIPEDFHLTVVSGR